MSLALIGALALDAWLGEPRRWHPLVGFGRLAGWLEARLNRDTRTGGLAAVGAAVVPPVAGLWWLVAMLPSWAGWAAAAAPAALCIGRASLQAHVQAVAAPLAAGDLALARQRVALLVSRETAAMDAPAIRRAAIESALENGSDGIFATLFWFAAGGLVAGPGGAAALAVAHRLVNTLDAMWGYRSPRHARFGWAAARLDDAGNWPAARLTALGYALAGRTRQALACWRRQAPAWDSPNAGPVMSAGAGALGITLGGGGCYHGAWRDRPWLGEGGAPVDGAIRRALALIDRALVAWCGGLLLVDWLC